MSESDQIKCPASVALVAPLPPPFGGMAVQAVKLKERLEQEGITVRFVASNPPFPKPLAWCQALPGLRTALRFLLLLRDLMALRQVDVVHVLAASHLYFFVVVFPALCAARIFGKRAVLNYRGGEAEAFFARYRGLARGILSLAHVITVPSPFLQEVFRRSLGLQPEIQPNLADFSRFSFRLRKSYRPFLVVSRQLEALYNHETILNAFALVAEGYPDATLTIVGGGSQESRLKGLCRELGLEGVRFTGPLGHRELASLYDQADIMVNASLADNFPGAILEAFMCGLPVVTSNAGGIPFLVQDGSTGFLVDPHDAASMAQRIVAIVEKDADAAAVVLAARDFAEEYRWENIRKKLFEVYGFHIESRKGECRDQFPCQKLPVSTP